MRKIKGGTLKLKELFKVYQKAQNYKEEHWENPPRIGGEGIIFSINRIRDWLDDMEHQVIDTTQIDISEYKTKKVMHPIQKKLLQANKINALTGKGYRKIAKLVGANHPQQVKWHLIQLKKKGLI